MRYRIYNVRILAAKSFRIETVEFRGKGVLVRTDPYVAEIKVSFRGRVNKDGGVNWMEFAMSNGFH